jgi:antitoxin component of MazEF toxin-antitoxin module
MQRLTRWGNSTGIRLGKTVLEGAGLKAGDYCLVRLLDSGEIRICPARGALSVTESEDTQAENESRPRGEAVLKW